ncbi:MAG: hypothetical protein KA760_00200 [Steroidobacteraceae bacterium]|jgi:hypothetical protein|nr:hypothetical protein [Steroidobacteraceae bacterium]MBP9128723.1 hypothetical protein [Steroidobacteraceae bacterium]
MERSKPAAATLLMCSVLLQGCLGAQAGDEPVDDKARRVEARRATAKPLPERVAEPRAPVTGEAPADLVARVREDVIRRSGADPSSVRLIRDESVTWSDGSLGCPLRGEFYTQAPVPGYWIVFDVVGRKFDYRSNGQGNFRLCESPRVAPSGSS